MNHHSPLRLLFLLFVLYGRAFAQALPDAPSRHKFWDRQNKTLFIVHAGLETADFPITHHNLANGGRGLNPIGRPIVESGTAGQVTFSAGRTLATRRVVLAVHRTGPQKSQRDTT